MVDKFHQHITDEVRGAVKAGMSWSLLSLGNPRGSIAQDTFLDLVGLSFLI